MPGAPPPIHVSLVALPESMALPMSGVYETLGIYEAIRPGGDKGPAFDVEIIGRERGILQTASGLPVTVHRGFSEVEHTDIVIVTSMAADDRNQWRVGRHSEAVEWLKAMNSQGALLCSGCTGVLLVAETGLLRGLEATIHWAFAPTFRHNFPDVRLNLRKVLVTGGERREFVMAGATGSWQDLVLYLVARHAGSEAARALGKFMLFQWHSDSQAPYISFAPFKDHGDAVIREAQEWLAGHLAVANPVEEVERRSGLPETTFKRRFKRATGYSPLQYVQNLRVETAKQCLESTKTPIEEITWKVGYEDPAFFRRLFKRITGMTPGGYRRKFKIPDFGRDAG